MNDKPKGTTFPKQQLEIVKYEADISYGTVGKTLDRVQAKNLSLQEGDPLFGKSLRHTIFNGDLKAHLCKLEVGSRFLADVEERDRPDKPDYGPDRTIVQVYIDGKPISQKKGGGGYGKSPEIVRLEHELDLELEGVKRRSIEGQTAVAQVGTVLTCPTPIPGEDLGIDEDGWKRILGKYWQAVEKGLDNYLTDPPKTQVAKPPQEKPPKAAQKPQDGQGKAEKPAAVSTDEEPIKHAGDLLTRALKLKPPVTRDELMVALAVNDPKNITDLAAAWKTALEISASKGKGGGESSEEAWDKLNR